MKKLKQWELKPKSKILLPDGRIVKFIKMDGMYAQWDFGGKLKIGNYEEFEKVDEKEFGYNYKVISSL